MWSGLVWSGLVWCGVVWCVVVWCGVALADEAMPVATATAGLLPNSPWKEGDSEADGDLEREKRGRERG